MRETIKFTPVNRIGEPCSCCAHSTKRGRGVRVDSSDGLTFYYCNSCIGHLAKAKEHP